MLDDILNLVVPHYFWHSLNELTMTITKLVNQIIAYLPSQEQTYSIALDMFARSVRILSDTYMDSIGVFHFEKRNKLPPITDPLLLKPAIELSNLVRTGQVTCETLISAYIKRITDVNGKINALVSDCFIQALEEAKAYDVQIKEALQNNNDQTNKDNNVLSLPLLGVPISIKESIAVKGQPITAGLVSRKGVCSEEDSEAVTNLRNSGAIVIGVTNVPEFLLWWDSNNKVYGRTNNPYDLSRISGGSSGGEGALISSAGSVIGLGSDIGGSIRIPSFLCGVFGHKPSSNVTSIHGTYPYVGHPDREKYLSLGPICRYAVDLKYVFKPLIGEEMTSLLKLDEPVNLDKCKFYFLMNDGDPLKSKVSSDIVEAINRARDYLQSNCGYQCLDANLPLFRHSFFMWATAISDMDTPLLSSELLERKGEMNGFRELVKSIFGASQFRSLSALNVIMESIFYDRDNSRFRKFVDKTKIFKSQMESLLDDNSILIMPCLPQKAPKHNGTFLRMNNCGYTAILNICEVPSTQVSMGVGRNSGMPVGFQVVAKRLNDRYTLAVAELLAKQFGGWQPPCGVQLL